MLSDKQKEIIEKEYKEWQEMAEYDSAKTILWFLEVLEQYEFRNYLQEKYD